MLKIIKLSKTCFIQNPKIKYQCEVFKKKQSTIFTPKRILVNDFS